jgi:hypothetical protein
MENVALSENAEINENLPNYSVEGEPSRRTPDMVPLKDKNKAKIFIS